MAEFIRRQAGILKKRIAEPRRFIQVVSGPRQVGYALHALPDGHDVPWHRIINARGKISLDSEGLGGGNLQRALLEAERVVFNEKGRVDLKRYQWKRSR